MVEIIYNGKKYDTDKDNKELKEIWNKGLEERSKLAISLGIALIIAEENKNGVKK